MEQNEIWKDVKGYEGLYQVSNFGRIRSFLKTGHFKDKFLDTPEIRTPGIAHTGYMCIVLVKDGKRHTYDLHRLIAETFIPNPENKRTVNHIDGNKLNNKVDNLEWTTDSENQLHAHRNGLKPKNSKAVRCIETGEVFVTGSDAARSIGYNTHCFSSVMKSGVAMHGYHFEFIEENP